MRNKRFFPQYSKTLRNPAATLTVLAILAAVAVFFLASFSGFENRLHADPGGQDSAQNNRFEPGSFEDPANCMGCHEEIYEQWSRSKHQFAWVGEFYQPDYLQAGKETDGLTDTFCGECHAPVAVRTGQLPPADGSLFDQTSTRGISCDYCHTVSQIVDTVNVKTVSDPGDLKRGPRGDGYSSYHDVEFSLIHTESAFCGACHNVVHPVSNTVLIDTYDDWKEGPYAEENVRCQDCHMTPGPGVGKNPGRSSPMGEDREHVATHFFHGGSVLFHERMGNEEEKELALQMLQAAADLDVRSSWTDAGLELLVEVKNTGAGHKIPTGVTYIRKMWLEVTLFDELENQVYTSGHVNEDNRIDPNTEFYRKVFRDGDGNLTSKSWFAEEIAYDRRIPARGSDVQTFYLPVNNEGEEYRAVVRLMYRSLSQEAADNLDIEGLKVESIEMARTELSIR